MPNTTTLMGTRRFAAVLLAGAVWTGAVAAGPVPPKVDKLVGQPADIAPSAYLYRADRRAEGNPPEAWVLLMQHANLPFDQPVNTNAPEVRHVLCGLLWEEVRPVRRLVLSWPRNTKNKPAPEQLAVSCFNGQDDTAHTWWNPRTVKEAAWPEVSADGLTYSYAIPVDTWGVVAAMRGPKEASAFAVPELQAFVPDRWKQMDVEIEWGYEAASATLDYDGHIEVYDGRLAKLRPLGGDHGTRIGGPSAWRSAAGKGGVKSEVRSPSTLRSSATEDGKAEGNPDTEGRNGEQRRDFSSRIASPKEEKGELWEGLARRGVRFRLLYIGDSRWRRVWPYHAQPEDVARTIVTVWTKSGSFSFLAGDLEHGPVLAPEHGFFVRATGMKQPPASAVSVVEAPPPSEPPFDLASSAKTAREFLHELDAKHLATIRQRSRAHAEQTWLGAVTAMRGTNLPPLPQPPFAPAMEVEVPSEQLTAQWNLGAWHLLRHSVKDAEGRWRFNDFPFGILASETFMMLRALDLQGMHREAADGLDQWLGLPLQPGPVTGTHPLSKPDRPLGHFSDGLGCLTHAVGPDGAGGHMDAIHCMGPGAIMFALAEHFRLTGDLAWLKANAPRMKANAEWILRQRRLLASNLPGGERLWSKGLQPAHVVTPDSLSMHMQFYETEAYYWLAVKSMAEMLARLDPAEGARLAAETEAYRQDLVAAIDRSIALTPVVPVRDGTYHSFIPFAPYVRGFAAGAWGWRRCQGHVGAIYWDTVQSADPLVSPAGLLSPDDPRVQGHLDVLEDRLLLENEKVAARTPGFDPEKDWFAHASWQYQCGLERHANIHLAADDAPNFLRSMLNQYAVDIMPGEYTFREHTTTGPPDKLFEESCFLERFRMMLVMEEGDVLWLARATPRAWLEQGKRIAVRNAPTHFGPVGYEVVSDVEHGRLEATVTLPSRNPPREVVLVLRHPASAAIAAVKVNGKDWTDFDAARGWVRLHGLSGQARLEVNWASAPAAAR